MHGRVPPSTTWESTMLWTKGPQPLQLSLKRGSAAVKRHGWGKRKRLDTSLVLLIVPYRVRPIKLHSNYYKGAEYSGRARALQLSLPHSRAFYSPHYISAHVFIQNRQKNVESLPSFSLSRHEGQFCDLIRGVVRGGGFQKVVYVNGTQNLKTFSSSNLCTSLSPLNRQASNHSRITQYLHILFRYTFRLSYTPPWSGHTWRT
jgi:hypothetical protein